MFDKDALAFVRTGLDRYPDARATVDYFESQVYALLVGALQRQPWRTFQPAINEKGVLAVAKAKGDTFLHAWIKGSSSVNPVIRFVYLGIYWKEKVVATAGTWDANWKRIPLMSSGPIAEGLIFSSVDQSVSVALDDTFEPEAAFARLLDAVERTVESTRVGSASP
ncbi:MAG: hypothetical protein IT178_05830 [Acidobacteria bacterium]|nr:hypothetical protein [Acidobacteriota bacterium]